MRLERVLLQFVVLGAESISEVCFAMPNLGKDFRSKSALVVGMILVHKRAPLENLVAMHRFYVEERLND